MNWQTIRAAIEIARHETTEPDQIEYRLILAGYPGYEAEQAHKMARRAWADVDSGTITYDDWHETFEEHLNDDEDE